jgi:hypothetical protein
MPLFYSIDVRRKLVTLIGIGEITLANMALQQQLLKNDRRFNPGFARLLDLTAVSKFDLTLENAKWLARNETGSSIRFAVVATAPAIHNLALLISEGYQWEGREMKVFYDRTMAKHWLSSRPRKPQRPG